MGNTKRYYVDGVLRNESFAESTESLTKHFIEVGRIVGPYFTCHVSQEGGGYLGVEKNSNHFAIAAFHSYSMNGDKFIEWCKMVFEGFTLVRYDCDWSDIWTMNQDGYMMPWKKDKDKKLNNPW